MGEARMRIVLADDDILLREGIASLLERAGFEVVGQAHDAPGLLALIREHRPDLAIVDIRMPPDHLTEGLDAARVIRQEFPAIGILVLSAHAEVEQAMELLATGQRVGYLLKRRVTDVGDFAETVGRIAMGGSVVDPALVQELITARRRDNLSHQLTEREREVLALMAEGRSNSGIAHRLWITEGTVEKHVRSILARMDLPETEDDHRRVLAVLAYLDSRLGPAPPRAAARARMPRIAAPDRPALGKNETAGLSAIMSAKSSSECTEMRITDASPAPSWAAGWGATSKPSSSPRAMSTRATSGVS